MSAARKSRLVAVDDAAVLADYEADITVAAICAAHEISLTRLYQILDQHRVARRRPNAPKLPARLRRRILADYTAGVDVTEIARRHGVAASTVSKIAQRHGVGRVPKYTRDELVDFVVRYLVGEDLGHEQRYAIRRVGCRTRAPGLRTMEHLDPAIVADVKRRLIDALRTRLPGEN